jgi:predicted ArsR family transcriptional regulator
MKPDVREYTTAQRREGMRQLVLLHLKKFGGRATARELAQSIGKALKHVWPRVNDLKEQGRIRDTGQRVKVPRGRPQVIWADAATPAANDTLACDETNAPGWFKNFGT